MPRAQTPGGEGRARQSLERAEIDAELAIALVKEERARESFEAAQSELQETRAETTRPASQTARPAPTSADPTPAGAAD